MERGGSQSRTHAPMAGVLHPAIGGDTHLARWQHRAAYDVETNFLGGVEVLPVYFFTGPDAILVTSTPVTAVPPIQLPVGVTAGGAVVLSFMTSAPWKPKCTLLEYERGTKPGVTKFFPDF